VRKCDGAFHQNRRQKVFNWGGFTFVQGELDILNMIKLHCVTVFHIGIWGTWSIVWGAKPTKAPRGDGTAFHIDR